MSDSNSPRGEHEQEQEQEQRENQLNSSSTMTSISETLDPAQMGISLADLDADGDVDVDVVGVSEPEDAGLTNAEIFPVMYTGDVPQGDVGDLSDIWPGPMDLAAYGPVSSSRVLAVPPEAWLPPDDENWIYDFNEEALNDEVYDSDSKVVPLMIVSFFYFFFYFYLVCYKALTRH